MKKKSVFIIGIAVFIITIIATIGIINLLALIDKGSVEIGGRCARYVNNYNEYYSSKKEIVRHGFMSSERVYKLYFAPGKKEELLNKIKLNVNQELQDLKENNKNIIQNYSIGDDFRSVSIYYYSQSHYYDIQYELQQKTVALEIEFYNQLINGYGNSYFNGEIVKFIELNEQP